MKNLKLEFPLRRERIRGSWQPLYFEPMVGSGERICVGMIAASADEFCVVPVEGIERLSCLYGKEGAEFIEMLVNNTVESLQSFLATEKERTDFLRDESGTSHWKAIVEGITAGPKRYSAANSIDEIARTGLMMCASLTEKAVDNSDQSSDSMTRTRVEDGVQNLVTARKPNLKSYFRITRSLSPAARPVRFGFVGQNLAANFSYLSPHYLQSNVEHAKSKLWDLDMLREKFGSDSVYSEKRENYEVFLYTPDTNDVSYTDRQHNEIALAVNLLKIESQKREVEIFAHHSINAMAERLIEKEAA